MRGSVRVLNLRVRIFLPLFGLAIASSIHAGTYENLLKGVQVSPQTVDYTALRDAWANSTHFDPYYFIRPDFKSFVDSMNPGEDGSNLGPARESCANIPPGFFVDMAVHVVCINLSEAAGDRPSAERHKAVFQGILDSIGHSGDGQAVDTAYEVVNAVEPWEYLRRTGQQIVDP